MKTEKKPPFFWRYPFLGDVGRPDLAQKAANMTQEELAGLLYESLQTKIMPLADDITVYPAHGAGSACGKNMQKETVDTLVTKRKPTTLSINLIKKLCGGSFRRAYGSTEIFRYECRNEQRRLRKF
ncbi:hypothetical protein BPO_1659 [Bergeyella porcorum]|uniref:Hydroxyacylglutathione hydrolase n=1 Tax=Bergeyella porcorum TaxID=1735111 RepID=A0AAU0F2N8_9FLAO